MVLEVFGLEVLLKNYTFNQRGTLQPQGLSLQESRDLPDNRILNNHRGRSVERSGR